MDIWKFNDDAATKIKYEFEIRASFDKKDEENKNENESLRKEDEKEPDGDNILNSKYFFIFKFENIENAINYKLNIKKIIEKYI